MGLRSTHLLIAVEAGIIRLGFGVACCYKGILSITLSPISPKVQ